MKENGRLVGLLKKVHQVTLEAHNDLNYMNMRVKEVEEENFKLMTENVTMKSKLQTIDDRQQALENISKAIKIAVGEFQKLKEQYDYEFQQRQHAEQVVYILQQKINKLEELIKNSVIPQHNNTPSLNNPQLKESLQLRNELLGVHKELRESIDQYELVKSQLNAKIDTSNKLRRKASVLDRSGYNKEDTFNTTKTFVTSVASPMSPSDIAVRRLTQLKSLANEVDAALILTPSNISTGQLDSSYSKTLLEPLSQGSKTAFKHTTTSIPTSSLDRNSTPIATTDSPVSSNLSSPQSRTNRRPSLTTGTVVRRPSVQELSNRPISPPKDGKAIQRVSKFDEYFDQLQDELLALQSPSDRRP